MQAEYTRLYTDKVKSKMKFRSNRKLSWHVWRFGQLLWIAFNPAIGFMELQWKFKRFGFWVV